MTYQGHKSWSYWNVSLWIGNDEDLYNLARACIREAKTKDEAARNFVELLHSIGKTKTPDGAKYSVSAVRAALIGL
jgi:hypothetical protein